jgi:hypothetical protein
MARWRIRLSGDASELELLSKIAATPELKVEPGDDYYTLTSTDLDRLGDTADVSAVAEERIHTVAGILKVQGRDAPSVAVTGVFEDGDAYVLPPTLDMRVRIGRPSPDDEARAWIALARDRDGPEARAFRKFRRNTGGDLFDLLEIIATDVGGRVEAGLVEIGVRGWAPTAELRRFRRTIQFYTSAGDEARHGADPPGSSPSDSMSMEDARRMIRHVLESWLDYRSASP